MSTTKKNTGLVGGLDGIKAGDTAISTVGQKGMGLCYRGYAITDLVEKASFEEVSYLLLKGALPNHQQLQEYQQRLRKQRFLPDFLKNLLRQLPASSHPMDVLRTTCSALGCFEAEGKANDQQQVSERLLAVFPSALLYWYHFQSSALEIDGNSDEDSMAGYFLHLLQQKPPSQTQRRALDQSLILYAEHEFNASTFAARVTASTASDFYSAVTTAIGTLRGNLHGGANEATLALVLQFDSPDAAEKGIRQALANKQLIMGFGHRVYKTADPRSAIIKKLAVSLGAECGDKHYLPIAEKIEQILREEKSLFPNLDFYSAAAYHFMGIPVTLFTPIFVCARVSGWAAHIMEQRENNRLIRPGSNYIGPSEKVFLAISER